MFSIDGTPPVGVADGWVYFDTSNGLSRIRADAPPLSWDLAFKNWEITQGIQNLNNDVPLVANKPTYVRVYGTKLSGPSALNVEALLSGTAGNGRGAWLVADDQWPAEFHCQWRPRPIAQRQMAAGCFNCLIRGTSAA